MLYSQMVTNAGCLKSLLNPAPQVRRTAPRRQLDQSPYVSGLSEHLSRVFRAQDIRTYHKPYNTLRSTLVHPKDRTPTEKKTGVVYDITCSDCGEHYIGETARTLEKRLGEHQKQTTSAIQEHQSQANHKIDWEGVKILDKESVDESP